MDETTTPIVIPPPDVPDAVIGGHEDSTPLGERLKRCLAVAAIALVGAGCASPSLSTEAPPTQNGVTKITVGPISIGAEGDANGLFNTREPIDVANNKYEKDGGILDAIPGLPNLVIGVKDPSAGNAPRGDGNFFNKNTTRAAGDTSYVSVDGGTTTTITPSAKNVTIEKTVAIDEKGNTQYERDFVTDTNTYEQALTPAETITIETQNLIKEGFTVNFIKVTGRASGEDHTSTDPSANIGAPSQNNEQLALQRANRGAPALQEKMGSELSGIPIIIGGVEVEPTNEQISRMTAAAAELNISLAELTERFNTSIGGLDAELTQLLTEALVDNRGIMYEIHASKTEVIKDGTFITTVVDLPPDVREKINPDGKNDWLFRIEIPGEILLLFAAIGAGVAGARIIGGKIPGPNPGSIPGPIPEGPIPGPIPKPPPGTPKPPPRPPEYSRRGRYRRITPGGQTTGNQPAFTRKQPRNQNFSKNLGNLAGGPGRRGLDKGGNGTGRRDTS